MHENTGSERIATLTFGIINRGLLFGHPSLRRLLSGLDHILHKQLLKIRRIDAVLAEPRLQVVDADFSPLGIR